MSAWFIVSAFFTGLGTGLTAATIYTRSIRREMEDSRKEMRKSRDEMRDLKAEFR